MLHIESESNTRLPEQFHETNNICAHLYDHLTDLLTNKEYQPFFNSTIIRVYETDTGDSLSDLVSSQVHILEWMKSQNMIEELKEVLTKHVALSIISDFVNFVYESIINAQKGKMSVAYALLRKPFTDELLLLEQLLLDPDTFIDNFFHIGSPKLYDPSNRTIDKKKILVDVHSKIYTIGLPPDMIYKIRYDKSYSDGINGISNQALHIVTTDPNYKTPDQNLNFVFSNLNDTNQYWSHYYSFLPVLLTYTACVADAILLPFLPEETKSKIIALKGFKRIYAIDKIYTESSLIDTVKDLLESTCEHCQISDKIDESFFELLFKGEQIICRNCSSPMEMNNNSLRGLIEMYETISSITFNTNDEN